MQKEAREDVIFVFLFLNRPISISLRFVDNNIWHAGKNLKDQNPKKLKNLYLLGCWKYIF